MENSIFNLVYRKLRFFVFCVSAYQLMKYRRDFNMNTINYQQMLHSNTIFLDIHADDRNSLFDQISFLLQKRGYVKNSYSNALKERENAFPTGLSTKYLPIALPHTEPINIKKPFIAMVKNDYPVEMLQMGTNEVIKVQFFFFLGITKSSHQVILLQKFMQLLKKQGFSEGLQKINSSSKMYQFLTKAFLQS